MKEKVRRRCGCSGADDNFPFVKGEPMTDHDQRFKTLLRHFLVEFLQLFYPAWAALFDFRKVELVAAGNLSHSAPGRKTHP